MAAEVTRVGEHENVVSVDTMPPMGAEDIKQLMPTVDQSDAADGHRFGFTIRRLGG
eukprot:CAMPEP_0119119256 /NCGR_PEP_ID=MMETSP1310-20130426/824_1 /TAXON_ID=464262 /ORGANISM="Genus nov. species nov., Strain RCC2339" /LENGTH=55 /DNA_ID=CAMNT_0007108677 /DNA_START=90 /DNA_END=254 /DNA_ORIENTATION=-